ncbi:MAG: DivIVA domain-containing protein [Vicinamibacterales bacterium]|jgi:cell division initiation protein
MKLTPADVQRQIFSQRFRGSDPDEVRSFLAAVAEEMAEMLRDKERVQQELKHLELIVNEHREREAILKNTLLTAQKVAEDIRETARKEADTIVKQADLQGDSLLDLAQRRAHDVERGILELRGHRTALRTDIRALLTRLTHLLDLQEEAEVEDNLRFLKRREEAAGQ